MKERYETNSKQGKLAFVFKSVEDISVEVVVLFTLHKCHLHATVCINLAGYIRDGP